MPRQADLSARCAAIIATLNDEQGWQLSVADRQAYHAAALRYSPKDCSDLQLRKLVVCYHQDHVLVHALDQPGNKQHDAAWLSWMPQVIAILRHAGLAWFDDPTVDVEDLAQVARVALLHALPNFRYASRFSTWSHQVIVQSVRRYRRDLQALKRAGHPQSLDQSPDLDVAIGVIEHPEAIAHARVLVTQIAETLSTQPDHRLVELFQLWAIHDRRIEEIGQHFHLSTSQVRVLIGHIRQLLQADPVIKDWLAADRDAPDSSDSTRET